MATWRGNSILVTHKCGRNAWIEWRGESAEFRSFSIIGKIPWVGDVISVCDKCGNGIHPFNSKEWSEA